VRVLRGAIGGGARAAEEVVLHGKKAGRCITREGGLLATNGKTSFCLFA